MAEELGTKPEVRFKDFTTSVEPLRFQVGSDVFMAPPVLSIAVMQDMVAALGQLKSLDPNDPERINTVIDALKTAFQAILSDGHAEKFIARIESKGMDAIGVTQIIDIMMWLLESYGLRPTQPSQNSSDGQDSDGTGTDSTAGVPIEV